MWEAGNEHVVEYELGCIHLCAGSRDLPERVSPVQRRAGEQEAVGKTVL